MARRAVTVLALLLISGLALMSAACGSNAKSTSPPANVPGDASASATRSSTATGNNTTQLVARLRPSVVHIASEVIDDQGHIVTNNHVITLEGDTPAQKITVTLSDGRESTGQIVGRDSPTDLAVLKIDADKLTPAELGRSGDLEVGQDVIAIGNALDLPGGPTVTKGVVSALNRVIQESNLTIPDAIQTDAAINPGNSGGPLLNMEGQVVGITTAVIRGSSDTLGSDNAEGIGLAISIDSAQPIFSELIAKGKIERGFLGVNIAPIDSFTAGTCNAKSDKGVLLTRVQSGSPADKAGLRECDVLIKVGETDINSTGDLFAALTKHRSGDKVTVVFNRSGKQQQADVTLG